MIVAFDIETTGLDKSKDCIIQLACIKFDNDVIIDSKNWYIKPDRPYSISIQAYVKHKIKPEFLDDKPYLKDIAPELIEFCKDCDLLTYNGISFDIPFLEAELNRHGFTLDVLHRKCYDAFREERRRYGNSLTETYKRYNDGKTMEENGLTAHDAFSDVKATIDIFNKQQKVKQYDSEHMLCVEDFVEKKDFEGKPTICFTNGKYKDLPVTYINKIDKSYIDWIYKNDSFSRDLKMLIYEHLKKGMA